MLTFIIVVSISFSFSFGAWRHLFLFLVLVVFHFLLFSYIFIVLFFFIPLAVAPGATFSLSLSLSFISSLHSLFPFPNRFTLAPRASRQASLLFSFLSSHLSSLLISPLFSLLSPLSWRLAPGAVSSSPLSSSRYLFENCFASSVPAALCCASCALELRCCGVATGLTCRLYSAAQVCQIEQGL